MRDGLARRLWISSTPGPCVTGCLTSALGGRPYGHAPGTTRDETAIDGRLRRALSTSPAIGVHERRRRSGLDVIVDTVPDCDRGASLGLLPPSWMVPPRSGHGVYQARPRGCERLHEGGGGGGVPRGRRGIIVGGGKIRTGLRARRAGIGVTSHAFWMARRARTVVWSWLAREARPSGPLRPVSTNPRDRARMRF